MAEPGPGAAGGYVAFISYSHKDAKVGRWLHRKLEGYRLPKRLAGTQGEDGEVPARLTPIFRDREELPAAGDLSERVRAALTVSRNLVVLCSPNSAASPWVAKEIATFRELNPGRPIFTAIIDGEPGQCFSPALLVGGVEPLAADLRKEGDGKRLGLLKLVAGIAGVGLDALVQRDAARRIRSVTFVTGAAVAAMLVMALLTTYALQARAEADRQRTDAEGMVEFMLTDLRARLRGVGRIEIMQAVNAKALGHYGKSELDTLPSDSLLRRARLLRFIGQDSVTAGNLEAALAAFNEAHRITAEQLARAPDDPERQLQHAQSETAVGRIHELQQDWPRAELRYVAAAGAIERLVLAAPDNPENITAAAWSAVNLGNVRLNGANDAAKAQAYYEQAVQRFAIVAAARSTDTTNMRDLANAYGWLADSYYRRHLFRESLGARLKQHEIAKQLQETDPRNVENAFRLATAQRAVGHSYRKLGESDRAATFIHGAYRSALKLTNHDQGNSEWLLFEAFAGCDILFGKVGVPADVTRRTLKERILRANAALEAQENPRSQEIKGCVDASNKLTD